MNRMKIIYFRLFIFLKSYLKLIDFLSLFHIFVVKILHIIFKLKILKI